MIRVINPSVGVSARGLTTFWPNFRGAKGIGAICGLWTSCRHPSTRWDVRGLPAEAVWPRFAPECAVKPVVRPIHMVCTCKRYVGVKWAAFVIGTKFCKF